MPRLFELPQKLVLGVVTLPRRGRRGQKVRGLPGVPQCGAEPGRARGRWAPRPALRPLQRPGRPFTPLTGEGTAHETRPGRRGRVARLGGTSLLCRRLLGSLGLFSQGRPPSSVARAVLGHLPQASSAGGRAHESLDLAASRGSWEQHTYLLTHSHTQQAQTHSPASLTRAHMHRRSFRHTRAHTQAFTCMPVCMHTHTHSHTGFAHTHPRTHT